MHAISRWVIKRSFSDIAAMAEQAPEIICNQTFAINLSVIDLRDKDFILFLEDLQQHYCINASSIDMNSMGSNSMEFNREVGEFPNRQVLYHLTKRLQYQMKKIVYFQI